MEFIGLLMTLPELSIAVFLTDHAAQRIKNPRVVGFVLPVCFDRALLFMGFYRRLSRH
jgi:hypothetical protein